MRIRIIFVEKFKIEEYEIFYVVNCVVAWRVVVMLQRAKGNSYEAE